MSAHQLPLSVRWNPPMPDSHGAPIGADHLTRLDVKDEEMVKDAAHELRRCGCDADYARWARTWGERFIGEML